MRTFEIEPLAIKCSHHPHNCKTLVESVYSPFFDVKYANWRRFCHGCITSLTSEGCLDCYLSRLYPPDSDFPSKCRCPVTNARTRTSTRHRYLEKSWTLYIRSAKERAFCRITSSSSSAQGLMGKLYEELHVTPLFGNSCKI